MNSRLQPPVLIVAPDGEDYARRLHTPGEEAIAVTVCTTAAQAEERYAGQPIVFGIPDMIAEVISDWPAVEWVQSMWAGVRPLIECPRRDYLLTGVKGVFGPVMAEYVAGHLLAHELRIVQRQEWQKRHQWEERPSGSLRDKRAGIMGTGSIGSEIARVLVKMGVTVSGLNLSGRSVEPFHAVSPCSELHAFLRDLDYLISVLPDTAQTRRLVDADALAALPPHAVLINVGRGNVLDYPALIEALEKDRLAGAVLDVFEQEPLPRNSPLWDTPRLSITAHVAAPSLPAEIAPIFLDNYRRFCRDQSLRYRIDFERGY